MITFFFVGERPSVTALSRGWNWLDGRLCAKTLFNALASCGIDPHKCRFENVLDAYGKPRRFMRRRLLRTTKVVVALGQKVSRILRDWEVPHIALVHPAARGKIRKTENYIEHVRMRLYQVYAHDPT